MWELLLLREAATSMSLHPSQMAFAGIPGQCGIEERRGGGKGRGTSPLPTSAKPPPMRPSLLLLMQIKANARQSEGRGAEQGASVFSTGWCPEIELLCQLPQLKPSIRDLVYHIRVCKTSVSQHGCPPPLHF